MGGNGLSRPAGNLRYPVMNGAMGVSRHLQISRLRVQDCT